MIHAPPARPEPVSVAIVAYAEATASVVHGMFDFFAAAGRDWGILVDGQLGPGLMQPFIVSAHRGPFAAANGVTITPHATLDESPPTEIVCVPELAISPGEPLGGRFRAEVAWLRQRHAAGATIASACSGAVLLAEAGLLDGQDATTHWAYCETLQRNYPRVRVHPDRALVLTGQGHRLVMAGGGTAWHDLVLYLIGRFVGVEAAMQVARINLIDWHQIGQQPFARLARTRQVSDAVIARCQAWIAEHYREPSPVAAMLRLSGVAERTFKRRFRAATGMSPIEYVHTLRLEAAKQLLEAGDETAESIALEVGYEDAAFFRRLFRRHVQLTPSEYRKRFGALRRALAEGGV